MAQLFANNAVSVIAVQATDIATTLVVTDGNVFPSPTNGDYFLATLYDANGVDETNHEIVKVTARSSNSLTVVRGQEATVARAWGVGTPVELRVTAGTLDGFSQSASESLQQTYGAAGTDGNQLVVGVSVDAENAVPTIEAKTGAAEDSVRLAFKTSSVEQAAVGAGGTFIVGTQAELPWNSAIHAIQLEPRTTLFDYSGTPYITNNAYFDSVGWKYIETGTAAHFTFTNTSAALRVATYGTAGTAIPFWDSVFSWASSSALASYVFSFRDTVNLARGKFYSINNTQVVGERATGWTAATGIANKGVFATSTATATQCAERIKALEDALRTHGLIN